MNAFAITWLDLRETADRQARAPALLQRACTWLRANPDACVIDLGAGTGATLRALLGAGAQAQRWHLVDHDEALLEEAQRRHGNELTLHTHVRDLCDLDALPLEHGALVSASALFDLTSAAFCTALVERLAQHGTALYAALNYDGDMRWAPEHVLDAAVLNAFNLDQRRDKGFGPALGPTASAHLQAALQRAGYTVELAPSPWQLEADQAALTSELCHGCAAAVAATLDDTALANWLRFRLAQAATGTCRVGHVDLWAYPPA